MKKLSDFIKIFRLLALTFHLIMSQPINYGLLWLSNANQRGIKFHRNMYLKGKQLDNHLDRSIT